MKKAKSLVFFLCLLYTASVFSQGQNCNTATPFCDAPGGAGVVFPNNTNNSSQAGPNYGCLITQPNPAWFYFKTTVAGNYIFNLSQGTACGGANIDVDFICYGPFTSPYNCGNLTAGNTVDCSFSPAPTETVDVIGAPAGQYYIILVTNYANTSGCITLALSATSPPTDCSITCPTVLSGPGIVNYPSTNPLANVPATPMPSTVACNSGILNMYASNLTPFGNPIVPGVKITFNNNSNVSNNVQWFENSTNLGGFGACGGCSGLTTNYQEILQFSYSSPSATTQFSFCETSTGAGNIANTTIQDLTNNANFAGTPFTWLNDGGCQTITIPPGTIKGIANWSSTCGACLTGITDWGAAQFNPSAAGIGTHTITYSFNPQAAGCSTYTTSIVITVTNPYNAAFVTPGPFCAGAGCAALTPSNTYTLGTGTWSGTGVSGSNFCPATSGVGSFPVTYTVGTSPTCSSSQTNTITVNANPTANAGSPAVLTCTNASVGLTGSGGTTYSWTGPAGGISSGGNTATPTVTLAGTYTVLVANGTCTNSATVAVTQNTATPAVTPAVSGALNCTVTSVNASATTTSTPVSYNWSGPGITAGAGTGTISVNQAGTYNYTVTSNGCNTFGSQVVSQNTLTPAVTPAVTGVLNCTVASVNASASTTSTPVSYNWTGAGITGGAGTGTISVNQPGTYNYTVTAANGCSVTGTQVVTQNTVTPVVTAAVSGALTCTLTSVNASASTASTPVSYNWTGSGITAGAGTGTISVNQPGTYNYTVTATNGCSATGSQVVTQNTVTPVVTAAVNGALNCTLTSVNASATTTTTPVTYNWTGASITAGAGTGTVTVNQGGIYNYTVTATNGCSVTGSQAVTQNTATPSVAASVTGTLNCSTLSVDASATTTTSPVSYNWTGPNITAGAGTGTVSVNQPGTYNYTVTNTTNACSVTGSQAVTQNTTVPTVNAGTTQTLVCGVASVTLSGSGSAGSNATWLGGVCGSATSFTTTACAPGTYTLIATDAVSTCTNTSAVSVSSSTNVPQATVNAITNSITCTNSVVAIGVTYSGTDPVTYAWSGPGITGSTTSSVTTTNLSGTYNVTITNTVSGCQSVYSAVVPTNTTPVSATTASSATLTCITSTVNVSVTATPTGTNYAYSWTGPGTITNGTTDTPTVDANGNYVVTVTDNTNGCVGTFTATVISNTTVPTFTLGTASSVTTTCAAPNASLSATSDADPNSIYTWTTPSASTLTGSLQVVSAPGVYTVVVTNTVTGCSTSATSSATVELVADSGTPVVTLSSNSATITCSNPTPSVSITTTATPVTYNWSPTAGIVPGTETTANPVFNAAGTYSAVVTNTTSGCSTSTSGNVVTVTIDNTAPVITLSTGTNTGAITCIDPQVVIAPVVTPSVNLTYTWSPAGVTSTAINNATFTAVGVYTLAVTNTLTGCVSTSTSSANTFTVTVDNTAPTASINILSSNTSIGCGASNATVSLDGSSSTSANPSPVISWQPGSVTGATLGVVSAGTYTLMVVDAVNGCKDSTQITVTGNTTPPQGVNAGGSANIACGDVTTILTGTTTTSNTSYSWAGPSGTSIISGGTSLSPTVGEVGDYTLTVTDTSTGCSDSSVVNVSQANATASITANPTTGISPLLVDFTGTGAGNPTYSWSFGDGNTSGIQNPNNTFTTGTYTVTLTTTSGSCTATATVVIVVEDGFTIEIPNVFTPNGDEANDFFTIKSTGVKEISLQVFNRWGEKLYEFTGAKASWDGLTPAGAEVTEGTYFYFVKAKGFDGAEFEQHGTVNLFR